MFGILSYVLVNAVAGKARKVDKMMWVLAALFVVRIVIKALL